jgi:hypothetical protein
MLTAFQAPAISAGQVAGRFIGNCEVLDYGGSGGMAGFSASTGSGRRAAVKILLRSNAKCRARLAP